jgi:glutathione peroxidase
MATNIFDFDAVGLNGQPQALDRYRGQVTLIVNTASKCGFTPQYQGLEALHREFKDAGVAVLGFPCNQFGAQEPGTAEEIGAFCDTSFGVSFPLFAKIDVNGEHAHPLFAELKRQAPGILGTGRIKWNFTKFLVRKDGSVYKRYAPMTTPAQLRDDIKKLLSE